MDLVIRFLAETQHEFKKVTWPTRRDATRLTLYVVGGSLLVGFFVGGADALLKKALALVLLG